MKKKYQVFISSTYDDLHEERQEVIRSLLRINCIPTGMELFPASNDDAWSLIRAVIDDCDYYIVISAGKYGSTHPETGLGYTEMEYDYATQKGIPTLGFIHKDIGKIPKNRSEETEQGSAKLASFHGKIKSKLVQFWESPHELAQHVGWSITQEIEKSPRFGWVKANEIASNEAKLTIANLEKEVAQLKLQIAEAGPPLANPQNIFENLSGEISISISNHQIFAQKQDLYFVVLATAYHNRSLNLIMTSASSYIINNFFSKNDGEKLHQQRGQLHDTVRLIVEDMESLGLLETNFATIPNPQGGSSQQKVIDLFPHVKRWLTSRSPMLSSDNISFKTRTSD